jgi:hypothetical protein
MAELIPPLFVVQEDDLAILRDEGEATNFEPWFPSEERYSGFDSQGRRFELVVEQAAVAAACYQARDWQRRCAASR